MSAFIVCMTIAWTGIAMIVVGWIFFRQPGIPFRTYNASVTHAKDYLTSAGVRLCRAGAVIAVAALIIGVIIDFVL